jgi:hypothetical protein
MLGRSRYRVPLAVLILVLLLVTTAAVGCTAILGDFDVTSDAGHEVMKESGAPDANKPETSTTDALTRAETGRDSSNPDAQGEADAADTGTDVVSDTSVPEAATPEILTVKFAGTGTGKVVSSPAGINCVVSCTGSFDPGTTVTLTASASAGSLFAGWSGGGCSGSGACEVTTTEAISVTATFAVAATWDPTWSLAGVTFSNGNLSIVSPGATTSQHIDVRTTVGETTGKWYWEVTATGGNGTTDNGGLGILGADMPNTATYIGFVASGLSFGYDTEYWCTWAGIPGCTLGSASVSSTEPVPPVVDDGTVYMFALDMDNGFLWLGYDGNWNGTDTSVIATNYVASGLTATAGTTVYSGVTFYNAVLSFTANFGASAFKYRVPTGFNPGLY